MPIVVQSTPVVLCPEGGAPVGQVVIGAPNWTALAARAGTAVNERRNRLRQRDYKSSFEIPGARSRAALQTKTIRRWPGHIDQVLEDIPLEGVTLRLPEVRSGARAAGFPGSSISMDVSWVSVGRPVPLPGQGDTVAAKYSVHANRQLITGTARNLHSMLSSAFRPMAHHPSATRQPHWARMQWTRVLR